MKQALTLIIMLFSLATFGQVITADEWKEHSKTNIRLLPKYGHHKNTEEQKQFDQQFINETIQLDQFKGDRTAASNHMIKLGFSYLYRRDLKTAMYRFNQAYLLDTANADIYWGYGAVYMTLGDHEMAKRQYEDGLLFQPDNTHLLTDYGTYFMAQYYGQQPTGEKKAKSNLDSALIYLNKSYQLDNKDQNTLYKLSICYWLKDDCNNAWKYYDECKLLGGQPITEDFTNDLAKKCKRKK
jgi:hypothetical protein